MFSDQAVIYLHSIRWVKGPLGTMKRVSLPMLVSMVFVPETENAVWLETLVEHVFTWTVYR